MWIEAIATGASGKAVALTDVLGLLTLKINGHPERMHLASELDAIQTAYAAVMASQSFVQDGNGLWIPGTPQNAAIAAWLIGIRLCEPWRTSYAASEVFAWPTAWSDGSTLQSLALEIACPNTGNLSSAGMTLNVFCECDSFVGSLDANKNPVMLITKWNRLSVPYTGVGDFQIANPPRHGILLQLSAFCPTGDDISRIQIAADARIIRDVYKQRNDAANVGRQWNTSAISADRFDLAFDYSDLPTDGLVLSTATTQVQDLNVTLTMDHAAAATKLISTIWQIYEQADL
jgi:hypothetical protein